VCVCVCVCGCLKHLNEEVALTLIFEYYTTKGFNVGYTTVSDRSLRDCFVCLLINYCRTYSLTCYLFILKPRSSFSVGYERTLF